MRLPELPEATAWMFRQEANDVHNGMGDTRFVRAPCDGKLPGYRSTPLYTADQMRAYAELVREECAKVCDERVQGCRADYAVDGDERWLVYAKHAERLAAFIRTHDIPRGPDVPTRPYWKSGD